MMYSLPCSPLSKSSFHQTWSAILQSVTTIGRQTEPAIFAHFQPHAHATARLVRRFASYVMKANSYPHRLDELSFGAYMHDIGKYFIAPEILLKPGLLDDEERKIVSLHSVYGAVAISKLPAVTDIIHRIVLYHHEHWDGSGYPEGLGGDAIPLEARMVSVADVYISLRARRSYKPTLTKEAALHGLTEMAGRELDANLVEDFLRLSAGRTPVSRL